MLEHVHFHLRAPDLVERSHDRQLNLAQVEFALHLLILIIFQAFNVGF
jgi:hypothetical protein